jgi:hypothetical protein
MTALYNSLPKNLNVTSADVRVIRRLPPTSELLRATIAANHKQFDPHLSLSFQQREELRAELGRYVRQEADTKAFVSRATQSSNPGSKT